MCLQLVTSHSLLQTTLFDHSCGNSLPPRPRIQALLISQRTLVLSLDHCVKDLVTVLTGHFPCIIMLSLAYTYNTGQHILYLVVSLSSRNNYTSIRLSVLFHSTGSQNLLVTRSLLFPPPSESSQKWHHTVLTVVLTSHPHWQKFCSETT